MISLSLKQEGINKQAFKHFILIIVLHTGNWLCLLCYEHVQHT